MKGVFEMKKFLLLTSVFSLLLLVSCAFTPIDKNGTQSDAASVQTNVPSGLIGVDEAKRIALEKAGLAEGDVRFDRTELDNENGVWVYEIEFESGNTEYDAEIKADDGTILRWETDNN